MNSYYNEGEEEDDDEVLNLNLTDLELDAMNNGLNLSNLKRDGERSSTRGPCKCGYRHWVDGKEYDFVFKWANFNGTLGFNMGDNAYLAAQDFVMRHDVNKDSLNHRNSVNMIVNTILKHIDQYEPVKIDKPKSNFDPYKTQLHVPAINTTRYNKVTGKFEKTMYVFDELTPEQKEELQKKEEHQKQVKRELEEEKKKKSEIMQTIRRDLYERKKEEEYKKSLFTSPTTTPKRGTPTLIDGQIKYVDKTTPTKDKDDRIGSLRNLQQQDSDDDDSPRSDQDSDSSESDEIAHQRKSAAQLLQLLRQQEQFREQFKNEIKPGISDIERRLMYKRWADAQDTDVSPRGNHMFQPNNPFSSPEMHLKKSDSAFTGKGFTLGSSPEVKKPTETVSEESKNTEAIQVDTNAPQTSIRVRLLDGSTITVLCNHTHTLQQLVNHIRGSSNTQDFILKDMGVRPPTVLSEMNKTIKEANLLSGSIVQSK